MLLELNSWDVLVTALGTVGTPVPSSGTKPAAGGGMSGADRPSRPGGQWPRAAFSGFDSEWTPGPFMLQDIISVPSPACNLVAARGLVSAS